MRMDFQYGWDPTNKVRLPIQQIKRVTVPTTQTQSWKTTGDIVSTTINGVEKVLHGSPNFQRKKVLVIGSSTTATAGASTLNNGYAYRLKTALVAMGYDVTVRGNGGDTTTAIKNRFYTDVVPLNPDFVIIQLTLGNEGIQSNAETAYDSFKNGIIDLIKMCQQHGATPVIAGVSANGTLSATQTAYLRNMDKEFEALGVYMFNFRGAVADLSTNAYLASADSGDNIHPNDTGHLALYNTIPPSLFNQLHMWKSTDIVPSRAGGIVLSPDGTNDGTVDPILFTPSVAIPTFTVAFWHRSNLGLTAKAYVGIGGGSGRLKDNANTYQWVASNGTSTINSTVNFITDARWHHIAITHNSIEQLTRLYIDGVLIGSVAETSLTLSKLTLLGRSDGNTGGNAMGNELKDVLVYRSRLDAEQIKDLYNGNYLKSSLEIYSPMNDKLVAVNNRLLNCAPTDSRFIIKSSRMASLDDGVVKASNIAKYVQIEGGPVLYGDGSGGLKARKPDGTIITLI